MKKLLTILLVLNLSAHGQIADSLTVIEDFKGGTFNIDTLKVPVTSNVVDGAVLKIPSPVEFNLILSVIAPDIYSI